MDPSRPARPAPEPDTGAPPGTTGSPKEAAGTGTAGPGTAGPGTAGPAALGTDSDAAAAPRPRRAAWLALVAVLVLALDAGAKALVVARLEGRPPVRLLGGLLDLEVIRNSGAAFGLAQGMTVVFTLVAAAVIVVIVRTATRLRSRGWAVALGLILGGAAGNLADRLFRAPGFAVGHVVDWIHLSFFWPVFNLADSAITCGAVLTVLLALRGVGMDGVRTTRDRTEAGDATRARDEHA